MFSQERDQLRQVFFNTWHKHNERLPLEPLEAQVLEIILLHPEYHALLAHPEKYQDKDFSEGNPFLHLSLHISIREQIGTNRPAGIRKIYLALCEKYADAHLAEHRMLDCLAETLWQAQRDNTAPNESDYLALITARG